MRTLRNRSRHSSRWVMFFCCLAVTLMLAMMPLRQMRLGAQAQSDKKEAGDAKASDVEVLAASANLRQIASSVKAPSISTATEPFTTEVEPNNTAATAQPLTGTQIKVKGNIQFNRVPTVPTPNDFDFYSFSGTMGDRVYAATQSQFGAQSNSGGQSGDTLIEIFNTDGMTILETDDEDGSFNANSSSIAGLTLPATGTFFIRVRHFSPTPTSEILPYDLYLRLQSGSPTPETEPNNNGGPPNMPNPLPPSGWVSGAIDPAPNPPGPDSDVYSIMLNAGDTIYLSLDANPERDAVFWNPRLGFGLFDNFFLLVNDGNTGSAANPNSEAFFFTVRDAGTYFVFIDAAAGTPGPTFTYNMSATVYPPSTRTCMTYTSTDVPKTIGPDASVVTSTLTVPDNVKIGNLKVNLNITHAALGDLDITLIAPDGNEVVLVDDPPTASVGTTAPQIDLTLDDEAGVPWATFGVNKPMIVQPEGFGRLYWFKNQTAAGTWTLRVFDDTTANGGTLNGWGITVCADPPIPTCIAPETTVYSSDFEADDGMFFHAGTNDEWERGLPTFAPITTCNSGVNCWKTDLDNTYNPAPTSTTNVFQELASPNINLTTFTGQRITFEWAMKYQVEGAHWDHIFVEVRAGALIKRVFEHSRATMTRSVGNPAVVINQAAGWGVWQVDISQFAGTTVQLVFHLDNDDSIQLAGLAIDDVKVTACSGPTEARLSSFTATGYNGGQFIEWMTGYEVDNLGFNLYRDEGGKRALVNPSLVAGSALVAGARTALTAGRSYGWWDSRAAGGAKVQYWLEAIDLKGESTWYGPASTKVVGGSPPELSRADLLSRVGLSQSGITTPVSRSAGIATGNPATSMVQASLASQAAVKISAGQEGMYRVGQPALVAAGLGANVDPRFIQLFVDGVEQPIKISGEQDGKLDANDSVEFYGTGLDTPYSATRVYWLVAGSSPGKRIATAQGKGDAPSPPSFAYTVERKDRTTYFSSLRNGERENFFGPVIGSTGVDQGIWLRHVDTSAKDQAVVEVAAQGVTLLPHRVMVSLNGAVIGELSFANQQPGLAALAVPQSLLREGENLVRLVSTGQGNDVSLVNYIRLTYRHRYAAESNVLRFTATGSQQVQLTGFTSSPVRVFDITDPAAVQEVTAAATTSKSGATVNLAVPGTGQRTLLALADNQLRSAISVTANQVSRLAQPSNGADLLVITRRNYFGALSPLVSLRQGQGLAVALIDVEDIYDEWSYGQKSPFAIRDFLAYAKTSWKRKPGYVLLGGDASFDARDYLGHGDFDLVSSKLIDTAFLETFSDDWLADFNRDGLAELAVGRLPFRTAQEAARMVAKIVEYERTGSAQSVLLVSDSPEGYDFGSVSTRLRSLIPSSMKVEEVERGELGDAEARSRLIEAINRGQMVVNYVGHGSVTLLRGGLLTSADAGVLTNEKGLPLFVAMTCLNGYFGDPVLDSLAEAMVKAERRGAIAVWASSGMTLPGGQAVMNQEMFRQLFDGSNRNQKLGDATMRAKASVNDGDVRRTWILFGDPTSRLR
jgi:subtilisin-like proprotein convertase family protein